MGADAVVLDPVMPQFAPSSHLALDPLNMATDLSGFDHDGTLQGGATIDDEGPLGWEGSVLLDGVDDLVSTTYAPFVNGTTRTFEGWASRTASADADALFSADGASPPFLRLASGSQNVVWQPASSTSTSWAAAWPGNAQWVHWVLIFNETTNDASLYINGVLVSTQTNADAYNAAAGNLRYGVRAAAADPFGGRLSHVAVYERALAAAEIADRYRRGALRSERRAALDLNLGGIDVREADYGDSEVESQVADLPIGSLPVGDPRWPSRIIRYKLGVSDREGAGQYGIGLSELQKKVGLLQEEGGIVKRGLDPALGLGEHVYAEITDAKLHVPASWMGMHKQAEPDVTLELTTLAHFFEDEVVSAEQSGTGILEFVLNGLRGSVPGWVRILIKNTGTAVWRSLLYLIDSRHYNPSAALSYEAESLTLLDESTSQADTLAYGGNALQRLNLPTHWVGIAESAALAHEGTFRLWARVRDLTAGTVDKINVAAEWGLGSLVRPTRLPAQLVAANTVEYAWIDLGEARVDRLPGGQRWFVRLLGRSNDPATGIGMRVDRLLVLPVGESMGVASAEDEPADPTTFIAYDDFGLPSGGTLAGRTAKKGGPWGFLSGDISDFGVEPDGAAARISQVDTARRNMRLGVGVAASSAVEWEFETPVLPAAGVATWETALLLRYVDANNNLAVEVFYAVNASTVTIRMKLAGVDTQWVRPIPDLQARVRYKLRMIAEADGRVRVWFSGMARPLTMLHTALATGGGLDDGGYGMGEYWPSSTGMGLEERRFYNFRVFTPELDAVAHPGKHVAIESGGAWREEPSAAGMAPVLVDGAHPVLPPQRMEGRSARVLLMPSRGRPGESTDPVANDPLTARVFSRAAHLFVPETPDA